MKFFTRSRPAITPRPVEPIIVVDLESMNDRFDRSAGRWCDHCAQTGSHHTDRHNEFARALIEDEA